MVLTVYVKNHVNFMDLTLNLRLSESNHKTKHNERDHVGKFTD